MPCPPIEQRAEPHIPAAVRHTAPSNLSLSKAAHTRLAMYRCRAPIFLDCSRRAGPWQIEPRPGPGHRTPHRWPHSIARLETFEGV
jgi:hypothetical protein